ncbi:hypothetical protein F2P79_000199 [Pimephales promelas]|nr:hypothetical protein F2P79_000199 [Pimephales promelas]KAG1971950.1 hypothetical protein F2P79_000199 [Pimephales promelas]
MAARIQSYRDRRTHVCLSGGERLMMLNAVINGSEAFVVEQDLQGKMMAAFVGGKKRFQGFYSNIKI